jgi:hypothetical protein
MFMPAIFHRLFCAPARRTPVRAATDEDKTIAHLLSCPAEPFARAGFQPAVRRIELDGDGLELSGASFRIQCRRLVGGRLLALCRCVGGARARGVHAALTGDVEEAVAALPLAHAFDQAGGAIVCGGLIGEARDGVIGGLDVAVVALRRRGGHQHGVVAIVGLPAGVLAGADGDDVIAAHEPFRA